ncbi:MAG TPA: hypothetical protein VHC90_01920 [Bryobacteraceae bacterium]|nr:hypothetical protein [Bryobacteraceae bacterium]
MNIANAFHVAIADLKKGLSAVDSFVQNNLAKIQGTANTVAAVAEKLDPQAAPLISSIDELGQAATSEIAAAIHEGSAIVNSSDGTATVTLSAELYGSIKALATTLSGHPAVAAATAQS